MSFYLYKVLRNANEHIVTERKSVVIDGWRMEQRRRGYRGTPLNTFDGFVFLGGSSFRDVCLLRASLVSQMVKN